MEIAGFAQLRNELRNGNLENWFRCMQAICDHIYIFDQDSDDGSQDYYKQFDNVVVIESETNQFDVELLCKHQLLEKLLAEAPSTSWIFWMDGDTLLDRRLLDRSVLHSELEKVEAEDVDGLLLGHYNLWRSDIWYRTDNQYHGFMQKGVLAFWKNNGNLVFEQSAGLHGRQFPLGFTKIHRLPFNLIHRGFSTDEQIMRKYVTYANRGQRGYFLDRLFQEGTLAGHLGKVPLEEMPEWVPLVNVSNPVEDFAAGRRRAVRDIFLELRAKGEI